MNKVNNGTHRIVLTGGPGGGKTTAADLIRREVGDKIIVVPEAATMLFCGGFPRVSDKQAVMATQKAIFHVQKNIEDIQHSRYPGRILLCDRGTIDGVVYWPDEKTSFLEKMGSSFEDEVERYDAVIFFETAAMGDMSIEGGNPSRVENNSKAIELDQRLKEAWQKHPNFFHIPHQKSFMNKLRSALDVFQKVVDGLNGK